LVVDAGKLAGVGATSYTLGNGPVSRTIAAKTRNAAKR